MADYEYQDLPRLIEQWCAVGGLASYSSEDEVEVDDVLSMAEIYLDSELEEEDAQFLPDCSFGKEHVAVDWSKASIDWVDETVLSDKDEEDSEEEAMNDAEFMEEDVEASKPGTAIGESILRFLIFKSAAAYQLVGTLAMGLLFHKIVAGSGKKAEPEEDTHRLAPLDPRMPIDATVRTPFTALPFAGLLVMGCLVHKLIERSGSWMKVSNLVASNSHDRLGCNLNLSIFDGSKNGNCEMVSLSELGKMSAMDLANDAILKTRVDVAFLTEMHDSAAQMIISQGDCLLKIYEMKFVDSVIKEVWKICSWDPGIHRGVKNLKVAVFYLSIGIRWFDKIKKFECDALLDVRRVGKYYWDTGMFYGLDDSDVRVRHDELPFLYIANFQCGLDVEILKYVCEAYSKGVYCLNGKDVEGYGYSFELVVDISTAEYNSQNSSNGRTMTAWFLGIACHPDQFFRPYAKVEFDQLLAFKIEHNDSEARNGCPDYLIIPCISLITSQGINSINLEIVENVGEQDLLWFLGFEESENILWDPGIRRTVIVEIQMASYGKDRNFRHLVKLNATGVALVHFWDTGILLQKCVPFDPGGCWRNNLMFIRCI